MRIRLHTRYQNSAGERVRIVMHLKNISFEYVPIPELSSPDYARINPQRLMPALEVDGRILAQSMAIIELLEDWFPTPSIYPVDPVQRAEVRSFANLITADLHPINNNRVRRYLRDHAGLEEAQISDWYAHWIATAFGSLEAQLARRSTPSQFCFSEQPTLADICLVPQLANARRFNCDLSDYPLMVDIDARCRDLDCFKRATPEAQPDYPRSTD